MTLTLAPSTTTTIDHLGPGNEETTFLVLGDSHVGRQEHPGTGEEIDPFGAFETAIEYGLSQDVAAVIHAGDVFHDSATSLHTTLVQRRVMTMLENEETPFYYVSGNHGSEPGDELLEDSSNRFINSPGLTGTQAGPDIRLYGLDHRPLGDIDWKAVQFPKSMPESTSILVLHQTLTQLSGTSGRSVDLNQINRLVPGQFDVVIAGHHHDAVQSTWNGSHIMYTGATERMSTNENSTDRVAWLLQVENGAVICEQYDIP